ncbi:hypothetical protein J6590_042293 [Homalodisca vitripennis]|nr:hypothetical protein J6590_042293 [Homalodisca vitripennis]
MPLCSHSLPEVSATVERSAETATFVQLSDAEMPMLNSCCGCASLKVGTIISGALGVVIGAVTLVFILVTDVKLQTIVIDTLPPNIVKIILAINLVMTMLISVLLIIGALKRNRFMMLPWVILAIMLAIGLAISVIYTAVVFYLHNYVLGGTLWLIIGLSCVVNLELMRSATLQLNPFRLLSLDFPSNLRVSVVCGLQLLSALAGGERKRPLLQACLQTLSYVSSRAVNRRYFTFEVINF